jgi:hypothetical protein
MNITKKHIVKEKIYANCTNETALVAINTGKW